MSEEVGLDDARHEKRREQLEILFSSLDSHAPEDDAPPVSLTAFHVIVMLLLMAAALDQVEGASQRRLDRARDLSRALLREGGESEENAAELLAQAEASFQGDAALQQGDIDVSVCEAWLAVLEEEVAYLRTLLREF